MIAGILIWYVCIYKNIAYGLEYMVNGPWESIESVNRIAMPMQDFSGCPYFTPDMRSMSFELPSNVGPRCVDIDVDIDTDRLVHVSH